MSMTQTQKKSRLFQIYWLFALLSFSFNAFAIEASSPRTSSKGESLEAFFDMAAPENKLGISLSHHRWLYSIDFDQLYVKVGPVGTDKVKIVQNLKLENTTLMLDYAVMQMLSVYGGVGYTKITNDLHAQADMSWPIPDVNIQEHIAFDSALVGGGLILSVPVYRRTAWSNDVAFIHSRFLNGDTPDTGYTNTFMFTSRLMYVHPIAWKAWIGARYIKELNRNFSGSLADGFLKYDATIAAPVPSLLLGGSFAPVKSFDILLEGTLGNKTGASLILRYNFLKA